ncbi:hypothetical protein JAAARDRAFT_594432 [Jaapia argillacea MUCL 33604]|uniref:Uncharacterized protein n=1 Tax=Jaapia argillacea MUCL 33604 TaxID=933084 RepID=A0A067QBR8_9AGAM|nr:hypothetical protein JAAARDRAFT_594432 [Jaapia argillacea MUCL 33604]
MLSLTRSFSGSSQAFRRSGLSRVYCPSNKSLLQERILLSLTRSMMLMKKLLSVSAQSESPSTQSQSIISSYCTCTTHPFDHSQTRRHSVTRQQLPGQPVCGSKTTPSPHHFRRPIVPHQHGHGIFSYQMNPVFSPRQAWISTGWTQSSFLRSCVGQ